MQVCHVAGDMSIAVPQPCPEIGSPRTLTVFVPEAAILAPAYKVCRGFVRRGEHSLVSREGRAWPSEQVGVLRADGGTLIPLCTLRKAALLPRKVFSDFCNRCGRVV